jgi:hypothetical protein
MVAAQNDFTQLVYVEKQLLVEAGKITREY